MSVHKSQGLTLDRAEVSLARAFEAGMACVPTLGPIPCALYPVCSPANSPHDPTLV